MKAREVMKLLNICRTTLYHYTKNNIIKHTKLSNGYYDYDEHSVLKFIKKDNRYDVIYARVSTYKQKNDLTNQINKLQTYCDNNKINIQHVYSEIASGIDLDRSELSKLLDDIFTHKIKNIYISNKDRHNKAIALFRCRSVRFTHTYLIFLYYLFSTMVVNYYNYNI